MGHVHVMDNKGGIIVVANEKNKLIHTRTITKWRVCIDYRRLNKETRKDHFMLSFMDQMLERLVRQAFYHFLNGYSMCLHTRGCLSGCLMCRRPSKGACFPYVTLGCGR